MPGARKHTYAHQPVNIAQFADLEMYLHAAAKRAMQGQSAPDIEPIIGSLPPGTARRGTGKYAGLVGWGLSEETGYRYYDPATVAAERLLTAFGGRVIFNPDGKGHYYPCVAFGRREATNIPEKSSIRLSIDRITMNAADGWKVMEDPADYRNRSASRLALAPYGKAERGRTWALDRALEAYDQTAEQEELFVSRGAYASLIWLSFFLIDQARNVVPGDAA